MSLPGARGPSYITSQGTHFLNVPHLRSVKGSSTMEGCLFLYLKKVQWNGRVTSMKWDKTEKMNEWKTDGWITEWDGKTWINTGQIGKPMRWNRLQETLRACIDNDGINNDRHEKHCRGVLLLHYNEYHYSKLWVLLHMQLPWWWRCKENRVKYISSGFNLNPCIPCGWIQWKSMDHIMSIVELLTVLPDWSVWTPQWPGRYQDGRAAFHHGWPPGELYHGIQSTRTDLKPLLLTIITATYILFCQDFTSTDVWILHPKNK